MTVYVLTETNWDYRAIRGVFSSVEGARAAAPEAVEWRPDGVTGEITHEGASCWEIEKVEVQP